jgi:hypothetical protein
MFDATTFTDGAHPINRRSDHRHRSYLHGKLIFDSPGANTDCIIRNLSQIGAKIEIPDADSYRDKALLLVTKNGAVHETTTVWATATTFGLRFDKSFDLKAGAPNRLAEAYQFWLGRRLG